MSEQEKSYRPIQGSEGIKGPDIVETDEQKRTRETSSPDVERPADSAPKHGVNESPSTLRQNLMGAGADDRGMTEEKRQNDMEEFVRHDPDLDLR